MFFVLVLLFTALPILELALLFRIGGEIGAGNTIALVLVTGVLGAWLARQQGVKTLRAIQTQLAQGALPGAALFDGALILVAGALLVTPGVVTDVVGFSFLLPPWRAVLRRGLSRWARGRVELVGNLQGQAFSVGGASRPGAPPFPGGFELPQLDPHGPEVVRDALDPEVKDVQADVRDA